VVVTYRCNARCVMCNCFKESADPSTELSLDTIQKLPRMDFCNITGGEPFLREDLEDIVAILQKKATRIVISTNGYFFDRIIHLCERFPRVGIRVSIDGLSVANDKIRGIPQGYDRVMRCILKLKEMGHPDIGFGMTLQDDNYQDLMTIYKLARYLNLEFSTACAHNTFYFKKTDNVIEQKRNVIAAIEELINAMLHTNNPKKWFRAYFNHGLINYIVDNPRELSCCLGTNGFYLEPCGDVVPCSAMKEKSVMGNLNEQTFEEIWSSEKARCVREQVSFCKENCWMIGLITPCMLTDPWLPLKWVIEHKFIRRHYRAEEDVLAL